MVESAITNAKFDYIHEVDRGPIEAIDVHHIVLRKTALQRFFLFFSNLFLILNAVFLFLVQDKSIRILLWNFLLGAFLVKLLFRNSVDKECVTVMPAFGVQLETHYRSGRVVRRFVPISKILKPVLNECVTPVTCYWSLSLIVRGEEELMLVFKELRPPVAMLVPIWRALCTATDCRENQEIT